MWIYSMNYNLGQMGSIHFFEDVCLKMMVMVHNRFLRLPVMHVDIESKEIE